MTELNLKAEDQEQELILSYLKENASETLAEKINNGIHIQKDGKTVINRKNLDGFMKYATDEAKKLAKKNARAACIKDETVYGWAIHYFEEDSIEGTLYNEDGSEYKPVVKTVPKSTTTITTKPVEKPKDRQASLFDLFSEDNEQPKEESKEPAEDEQEEVPPPKPIEKPKANEGIKMYRDYMEVQQKYPNCIVAYRLGDFYEIFGHNAEVIADEIGLTLTGRDCGLAERVPMVGFPYHAADNYFKKIAEFHDLAIAEDSASIKCLQKQKVIDKETGVITDNKPNDAIADKLSELLKIQITVR